MLQYLLNATAIWLISLVVFDVFLKRETYHGYNRGYLLITLFAGFVLPLISLRADMIELSQAMAQPVAESVYTLKEGITPAAGEQSASVDWIMMLYLAGVAVSLALLLKEMFEIRTLFRLGKKSKDGVWTVVETGKEHSPFSAFRYVFINTKDNYSEAELRMILVHEEQHGHLLHVADLLFVQLVKAIFWFHPLIYVYLNRLLMVHEYQADKAVEEAPVAYGSFLIEQSLLSAAPSVSHSFSRSPVKNRITMLTKTSTFLAGSKRLLMLPVVALCLLCFSKNAFSDEKKTRSGNNVTYKGNVFEFGERVNDTLMVEDPATAEMVMKIVSRDPWPLKMNGQKIYGEYEINELRDKTGAANTYAGITSKAMKKYLLDKLEGDLSKLKDGDYYMGMHHIIVSKNGKIVYFDYGGLSLVSTGGPDKVGNEVDKSVQDAVTKKMGNLIVGMSKYNAAVVDGQPVNSMINDIGFWDPFTIKNGQVIVK